MTVTTFPAPAALGLNPERYPTFRPLQVDALEWLLTQRGRARVKGLCIPTGGGKSAIAAAYASLTGQRTAILVGTRPLQGAYGETLGRTMDPAVSIWEDLRGQSNYVCHALTTGPGARRYTVDAGPCHDGQFCPYLTAGCDYFDRVRAAAQADVVVFNYAAWLTIMGGRGGFGPTSPGTLLRKGGDFTCLILDEGDTALEWLTLHLGVSLSERPLRRAGLPELPEDGATMRQIADWALKERAELSAYLHRSSRGLRPDERAEWKRVSDTLKRLADIGVADPEGPRDAWVPEWQGDPGSPWRSLTVSPVWPAQYRELLLREIDDVVVLSATLTPGTVEALAGTGGAALPEGVTL